MGLTKVDNDSDIAVLNSSEVLIDDSLNHDTTFRFLGSGTSQYVEINMTRGTVDSNIPEDSRIHIMVEAMKNYVSGATCGNCGDEIQMETK